MKLLLIIGLLVFTGCVQSREGTPIGNYWEHADQKTATVMGYEMLGSDRCILKTNLGVLNAGGPACTAQIGENITKNIYGDWFLKNNEVIDDG